MKARVITIQKAGHLYRARYEGMADFVFVEDPALARPRLRVFVDERPKRKNKQRVD